MKVAEPAVTVFEMVPPKDPEVPVVRERVIVAVLFEVMVVRHI